MNRTEKLSLAVEVTKATGAAVVAAAAAVTYWGWSTSAAARLSVAVAAFTFGLEVLLHVRHRPRWLVPASGIVCVLALTWLFSAPLTTAGRKPVDSTLPAPTQPSSVMSTSTRITGNSARSAGQFVTELSLTFDGRVSDGVARRNGIPFTKSLIVDLNGNGCGPTSEATIRFTLDARGRLSTQAMLAEKATPGISVEVVVIGPSTPPKPFIVTGISPTLIAVELPAGEVSIRVSSRSHDDFDCNNAEISLYLLDPQIV